jgi:hypothetical protein
MYACHCEVENVILKNHRAHQKLQTPIRQPSELCDIKERTNNTQDNYFFQGKELGSNPRHTPLQASALPAELPEQLSRYGLKSKAQYSLTRHAQLQ